MAAGKRMTDPSRRIWLKSWEKSHVKNAEPTLKQHLGTLLQPRPTFMAELGKSPALSWDPILWPI